MTEHQTNPFSHDAIKREVQAALKDAAIYEIGSYGWLNKDEPDPEFIGHAMWQDAPPLDEF